MSCASSRPRASLEPPETVVDTVVLMYFLYAGDVELLLELLGRPIAVPRIVYDPDEGIDTPKAARSEITKSIEYQLDVAHDGARDVAPRKQAKVTAERLRAVRRLHEKGAVRTVDLLPDELRLVSGLTSPSGCRAFNINHPLHAGEAACLAVAVQRGLVLATDDGDAIKALGSIARAPAYRRIRGLLITAADTGRISRDKANAIHREMRRLSFWDKQPPFP
jgi:hypothetical protein